MTECLIGLGSNLGSRKQLLDLAVQRLGRSVSVTAKSTWFRYPAVGGPAEQQDFLNGAVLVETDKTPHELAELLRVLEHAAGRQRTQRWASRTLDCDLLLFGSEQIVTESLMVPHPRMMTRRFVLEPAAEIAPEMVHPRIGWTIKELYEHLHAPPYFAVIGPNEGYCLDLALEIANNCCGTVVSLTQLDDTTGLTIQAPLEFATKARRLLELAMQECEYPLRPVISTFCHELGNLGATGTQLQPLILPKLLIVTEPIESEFSRELERQSLKRVPTLHLSSDREYAIQDAIGAVRAMK